MQYPSISIAILTYKRQDMLVQAIETALQQDYPDFEVLVIDNHSEDGTPTLLADKFSDVRCIALNQNMGAAARNAGFEHARGEIIVTLDNDVFFHSTNELQQVAAYFQQNEDVGCITFKILQPDGKTLSSRDWFHPCKADDFADKRFNTYYIAEGASAFLKQAIAKTDGYDEDFFLGHEGLDVALKLFQAGFKIEYCPAVTVCHHAALATRTSWRPYYYNTRNYFLLWFKFFRMGLGLQFLLPRIAMHGIFALRTGTFLYYLRGLYAGLRDGRKKLHERTAMTRQNEQFFRQMLAQHPGFLQWLKRHKDKPQV